MITNLVASIVVSLVTNVTEVKPQLQISIPCPDQLLIGGSYFGCTLAHFKVVDDPNAKEKTVVTTCKEITTLKFDWKGAREVVSERVLWESNVVMKLEWRSSP